MNETQRRALALYDNCEREARDAFQEQMPDGKKGTVVEIDGVKYLAAVRRLTPAECGKLQTIPEWYDWNGTSETQRYRMLGNGWTVEAIRHCWQYLPDIGRPYRVLSLFDGMGCAAVTLKELGVPVEVYLSSEIDRHALVAEKRNFPDMVQLGSVTGINAADIVARYGVPDFICGGSPCQSFSFCGKRKGMATASGEEVYTLARYLELKEQGFEFEGQSYLFWEFFRLLTELREYNPGILFFLENVEMQEKWERVLSHTLGVRGCHINSALVSAQNRKRIYWSNIKVRALPSDCIFDFADDPFEWPPAVTDFPQPADRGVCVGDILQRDLPDPKYYLRSDTVAELMKRAPPAKLRPYLEAPAFSADDLYWYAKARRGEYGDLTDTETRELAALAYELAARRLADERRSRGSGEPIIGDADEE